MNKFDVERISVKSDCQSCIQYRVRTREIE